MEALLKFAWLVDDYEEVKEAIKRLERKQKKQGWLNEDDIERCKKYKKEKKRAYHRISGARVILRISYSNQTLLYIEEHAEALLIAHYRQKQGI